MLSSAKIFLALGGVYAALAVAVGAFGAHGLGDRLTIESLAVYQTGVQYHFWHALGLLAVGLLCRQLPASAWLRGAGWLLAAGVVLFSGSLYALALGAPRSLGIVTPFGGVAFMLGWVAMVVGVVKG